MLDVGCQMQRRKKSMLDVRMRVAEYPPSDIYHLSSLTSNI